MLTPVSDLLRARATDLEGDGAVPAISVGSVEVDVLPNARGVRQRLQQQLVPAANDVGDELGRIVGRYVMQGIARGVVDGVRNGGRQAQAPAARQGQSTGGSFARAFRTRVEAALRDLPEVRIDADSSPAEREIASIRAQLRALTEVEIGVDIDAAEASARIDRLQQRLQRLSAQDVDVQVRTDVAAASTQLAAIQAMVNRLDGQTANVDVDTRSAAANLNLLTTAALTFGPAIIPVLPVVAAGLGAIAAAGVAAAVGVGSVALVAVPAFKQIGTVLTAQKAAQDAASQASMRGGQAAAQAASRSMQLASAAQAVASAERNGAKQIAAAQQQVSQARRSAAQTAAQASLRSQQAARAVQDAEEALADVQRDARQAQEDLTAARRTAAQELADLNSRLTDSVLSQRDAEIGLKEATIERDKVLKSQTATELDKERALLAYDQAVERLKDQTTETARLKDETEAANKAGVDGSQTVKSAQEQLAAAQEEVTDKTRALQDAQADQARTSAQNAQDIADAQQRIADAQAAVGDAQIQAAESAASAQRQLAQAQMQTTGGVDQAAIAQAKYRAELAKLTPEARDTMNAYVGLRGAFSAWSKSLQPAVMPIFTRALNGLKNSLPGLTPFVTEAADAIGGLQDRVSRGFKSPWWKTFKKDLQGSVKPAITGLGIGFGNVFKGMTGVIGAFLPHMDDIFGTLQRITGKFAKWGQGLKGSPEFERFLAYSAEHGPLIADTLGKIFGAFLSIGQALSPISGPLLKLLGGMAEAVGIIADKAPWFITLIYGIIVATKLWALAVWAFNFAVSANPLTLIGLAILSLVGFVIYAYNKFDWFKNAVDAVWKFIQDAVSAVIDWFKGPFTRFFTQTIPGIFRSVLDWVKRNWPWILGALTGPIGLAVVAIIKHWDAISAGISDAWKWVKSNVLYPIRDFFTKTIPGWGLTLTDKIVGAFDEAVKGIKTAWDKIQGIAKKPVKFVIDSVYNNGLRKVWNLVTDAFGGKHLDVMKFAAGGIMPGYTPGRDVHMVPSTAGPVALSGGEAIMRPEWTRAVGSGYVGAMNSAARRGGVDGVRSALGFKDGGIFSGIGDVLGGAWDKVKSGASWLKDTFGSAVQAGVKHVVNPLIERIPGGDIGFTGLLKDLMKGAVARLLGAGKEGDKKASPNILYKPSAGVEQWRPVVVKALAEVGQSSSLANTTLRRMQQESGGNPTIVNRWDSNWQAGHPSVGLMQVIRGTFQAYAGKYRNTGPFSYGVSVNPMANVYSSMKYALGAYGSLSKAYDRAGGYDSGGYLQPGLNLAYNGTGRPEPVFTTGQANALTSMAGKAPSFGDLAVHVQVGDEPIHAIARAEVHDSQQKLIQVLNAN
ncbi:transglycosylase SLT domain-containing protein [Streptomyces sp. NPDC002680]|uniref:transglycosylase SLT domain-containing protein n=1 Tax=Streptomyces sp. NPDC002680 TaxID=3364659 RepID=UPI00368AFE07